MVGHEPGERGQVSLTQTVSKGRSLRTCQVSVRLESADFDVDDLPH